MNAALGHNKLTKFMRELSADLSAQYTNHCVRVTKIVSLKAAGIKDWDICAAGQVGNPC